MIRFKNIPSLEIENFIKNLDKKISFVNTEFGIELKTYGNILRIAINAIQPDTIENLIERLKINKELEHGLENYGGYTIEYLADNNPKDELFRLLDYLKETLPKQETLIKFLNELDRKTIAFFDNNDIDFAIKNVRNKKVEIHPFSALKKITIENKTLVFHSFNGQKDFDLLYNLNADIVLILYKQEENLYYKYLDKRKKLIEKEIKSGDRFSICGIEYQESKNLSYELSSTINNIASRLDELGNRAYEGYINECDVLLNDSEEKLIYKIETNIAQLYLESNDTIFTEQGELIKTYKIKIGDKIRIYPKEQLAENLYQVAVETEPEIFGKVEEHSVYWKQLINELRNKFGEEILYKKLKEKGLRILPNTLATYGKEFRKFPMYKTDLKAIFKLYFSEKNENEIIDLIKPILKSKTIYNSTMIVLGRGLKQELRLFLRENKIGEILQKRNFNESTLREFVDKYMPLHMVLRKEVFKDNIETLDEKTLQIFEL